MQLNGCIIQGAADNATWRLHIVAPDRNQEHAYDHSHQVHIRHHSLTQY